MPMFNPVSEPSFRLDVAGLPEPFEVLAFTGKEALNEPYVFDIELLVDDAQIDLASLMHRSATLYFGPPGNCICGQLQELVQREHGLGTRLCQVRLGPKLAWLAQRFSRRIFSACSVPQILDQVLKEHGIIAKDRRFELEGDYPIRDFCTQYQESDLQFLQRLCGEERLHFRFEHRANRHCLVFDDDPQQFPLSELAGFRTQDGQPAVRQFQMQRRADTAVQFAQCQTDLASLRSGQRMMLLEHPLAECSHCWLLTHIEHQGSQDEPASYRNRVRAVDANTPFEPPHSVIKPRMYGLQRAWVVEVDELRPARDRPVPVQFDWLYQGEGAAPSHCWLPLADPLQSVADGLLQVGAEVVVSFIDGDPDQPLITGLLYRPESAEAAQPEMEPPGATIPAGVQQWLACAEPLMLLCLLPGGGSFNHCAQAVCTCRAATRLSQSGRS
jgi:type VI secretion system secreted protein VgrG